MKAVRTALVITALALGLASGAGAQQPQHGESFTLNTTLNPAQDHEYAAGWCIDLLPGFQSQPQAGSTTQLRIDPFYNTLDDHGLPYNTPPDHDISGRLGFYPMDFRVNDCGAATISMPLEFPEGINGMTPHLSLEYNSQAGNGIMGLGWSLGGMSKISRVPYTYVYNDESHSVHFSSEDQLSLDGVVLRKGTVDNAVCYYPEFYDYSVVYPVTGGFKVLKKDGLVYSYTSCYYLQQTITEPIEWHLSKVEDTDGNSMEYEYWNDQDNGAFWPTGIRYTCREGVSAYEIRFVYDQDDERPDCPKKWFSQPFDNNCNTGFSRVTKKLVGIDCYHGEDLILGYSLTYDSLDWNIRALAYVKKYFYSDTDGRHETDTIIPEEFAWNRAGHNLQYEQVGNSVDLGVTYSSDWEWYQQTAFPVRFNQNRLDSSQKFEHDIVHLMHNENNNPHYWLNVLRNYNYLQEQSQIYSYNPGSYRFDCSEVNDAFRDGRTIHAFLPADTDGDGLDEIACVFSLAGNIKVSLIKPDVLGELHENILFTEPITNYDISSFQTGDFNGDGLADLFCIHSNHVLIKMSVQGNAFSTTASNNYSLSGTRRVVVADFSGDLKDQILVLRRTGDDTEALFFRIAESQNGAFTIPSPKAVNCNIAEKYFANSCNRLCCGDFNGDGKKDILLMCSGVWRFHFSQGNGMFTVAQLMSDNTITGDSFAMASEHDSQVQSFALVADFDHDGCDDVSITLVQNFERLATNQCRTDSYKGAFRRDFLIRPLQQEIAVRLVQNLRSWWENGTLHTVDQCIDSIITFAEVYSTINPFIPIMGNHKGVSPNEILYCRMGTGPAQGITHAFLHNTGNLQPDSLARAVTCVINSLGSINQIHYIPVSYQRPKNENAYGKSKGIRSLTSVLPFNGFMIVVDRVMREVKDRGSAQGTEKTFRLTRYLFDHPCFHTRGRGLLGFETLWMREQGQFPRNDVISVTTFSLNTLHDVLVPETLTVRHFMENNTNYLEPHLQTRYNITFQDNTDFSSDLGQIPNGVFAPYIASTVTVRNDGTPQKYEKTVTERDGYGNITSTERRFGNDTTSYPYYEKTVTTYDHSVGSIRWLLGVPKSKTTTQRLVGTTADKVIQQATWQNDMVHGRHTSMTREPNTNKWLSETYGYDDFGHLTSVTRDIGNGNSRTDIFSYSNDGRFMTMQTDAAGHTTHCYHNDKTGLLDSVTDPNGLTTRYRYDILWNLIQTEYPSGVKEDQCMMWVDTCHAHTDTWHPDTPNFGAPVYFTWSKRSGERESVVFYDQHRRKLREVGGTMDGKKVYVDYRYHDVTGLMTEVSAPYYPGDGETPQFTQYTYDYLDRCIRTDRPDGAYSTNSYDGLTETVRGFDGQRRKLTRNCAGIVTKVSDYGNSTGSAVNINYTLYGDGSVKTSKVGGDNATLTSYTYDVNRNPVTVNDPSLGLLTYDYDGFGDLVGSVTPRDISQYSYDVLGRITARTGYDGTSSWTYDNGFIGEVSQTVYTPTAGPSVTERFTFDRLGRLTEQAQTIGTQEEWVFEYGYDALGRCSAITYPSGKTFRWHHDRNGFMDKVCDAADNSTVWQATATDRWGNTTEFTGGGISVSYGYDPVTGLPTGISARKGGQTLFGQACSWTTVGNLEWRTDTTLNLKETFTYDRFNRLLKARAKNLAGTATHATQEVSFNTKGNIIQKDGVGGYAYGGDNPYAVTALGPDEDVAGILTGQTVAYTPFDKVGTVSQDGRTLSVDYGIDRQRVTQTLNDGSSRRTKRYFTPLYETVTENGVTKKLHYLTSCTGLFAIFVSTSSGGGTMYYTLKDHQGSLAAVIQGNTVERLSYDPWGRRRNTTGFGYGNVSHTFDRGYTLHEHYDGFDLINMNGRLYDPILGRMLSPDIVIQDEQSSQAYNRYSYCFNNPLRFTDPSGYVVTIPPEFEKYYMPEYLNDFDTYKKELEKLDAQNVAFNTELSEGKSVTTLTWTLGEDSYQMTIVDHGLKDYEQMCENSCVASALAAQEARFTSGNKELTENFILSLFDNPCEQGLYVDKVLPFYKKYSNIYKSNTYFDMTKQLAYYEKRSFDEMNLDRGVLIRLYNDQMRHVFNVSQAIEFVINNNIKSHEIRLWNSDFQNEKKGGYKSFTDYDMKKFFGKMGVLY